MNHRWHAPNSKLMQHFAACWWIILYQLHNSLVNAASKIQLYKKMIMGDISTKWKLQTNLWTMCCNRKNILANNVLEYDCWLILYLLTVATWGKKQNELYFNLLACVVQSSEIREGLKVSGDGWNIAVTSSTEGHTMWTMLQVTVATNFLNTFWTTHAGAGDLMLVPMCSFQVAPVRVIRSSSIHIQKLISNQIS